MEGQEASAQQRRETFARYGLAMYHAQCVEKSLAILVSSVFNKEYLSSDPTRRGVMEDEVFAKTLGRLLKRMRKQISVPPNLDRTLDDALKKRNWLAHDYFWARAGELTTTRGRTKMIDELSELSSLFSRVDALLESVYEKWGKKVGIPLAVVNENMKKLIADND